MTEKLKVVIVGVLDKKGSTNIAQSRGFMQLGLDVIPCNYRTIIQNHGMQFFENLLIDVVKKHKPVLTLFSKCNGINPKLVEMCSKYSRTHLWMMDSREIAKRCPEVVQHALYSTSSSCTSIDTIAYFEEMGVKNCHHIIEGLDHQVLKPVEAVDEYKADISFVGTKTALRDEYLALLQREGYNVKFYGPEYSNKEVVDEEFAKVCSSSKCMLSLNTFNDLPEYFSDRVIRYLGCGVPTFHLDRTNSLEKYFKNGEEIIYFKDKEDLITQLRNTTPETLRKIAIEGREKVLTNYTWQHSIRKILNVATK